MTLESSTAGLAGAGGRIPIVLPARFAEAGAGLEGGLEGDDAEGAGGDQVEMLEFPSLDMYASGRAPGHSSGQSSGYASGHAAGNAAVAPGGAGAEPVLRWAEEIAALVERLRQQEQAGRLQGESARRDGRAEGRHAAEQEAERLIAGVREQVARLEERFRAEHEQYFRRVEREVVRLALAIAARVLHREASMDPLLLAGAVRVALEKLADTAGLVLRTSPGEVVAWQEMFRLTGEARIHPDVVGDLGLKPGECILETRLGTVELGVRAQLEEIEKGFFDLLNQKPKHAGGGM